ncbi:DUF6970 domain-containing protein [Arcticibacterium luteifluviistationis]|uniref:DUF6970 domain-containing protein n=1 Tax=Arcticibacterium luteifluviistationis TaxID=1784714 RepID=A0A2Z4G8A1_9BACT|nr:hypothetical protein [Arcticibacterium luteifluviistationis]AWV97407.1 hypothetical protein DJ013_04150 [Arcticibacterium luteifluviistationis]
MKKYLLLLPLLSFSCEKLTVENELITDPIMTSCLGEKVEAFSKEQTCETNVSIKSYLFQEDLVVVFDPGNCGADMAAEVFALNCERLGLLGGITGNTEINGEDFSNAVFQETVWEK